MLRSRSAIWPVRPTRRWPPIATALAGFKAPAKTFTQALAAIAPSTTPIARAGKRSRLRCSRSGAPPAVSRRPTARYLEELGARRSPQAARMRAFHRRSSARRAGREIIGVPLTNRIAAPKLGWLGVRSLFRQSRYRMDMIEYGDVLPTPGREKGLVCKVCEKHCMAIWKSSAQQRITFGSRSRRP
jgi:hypothetical protein